jgi:LDH2 family malate/lactate/ureidoglycolate dehydrogenase
MPADRFGRPPGQQSNDVAVPVDDLHAFAIALLRAVNVPPDSARRVADGLVAADLEDKASHGVALLPMYLDRVAGGSVSVAGEGRIVSDGGSAIVIDAENVFGQVSSERAVMLVVERARQHGLAAVAVRNGFHFGTAGRWAEKIAESGCAGMALSNTRPLLPAPGGAERVVGTNPLAIAVPAASGPPIVVDIALSAGAMAKIRLAQASGEQIPAGWACDSAGVPTTDPSAAIRGMLLPAGGAKGFALAVMVDILTGGLSAGAIGEDVRPLYGDSSLPYRCAHFFLGIDIGKFRPLDEFEAAVSQFAERIRTSRRAPDGSEIRMPGDRAAAARRRNASTCPLARSTVEALHERAKQLGVASPAAFARST